MQINQRSRKTSVNFLAFRNLLLALSQRPRTAIELQEIVGCTIGTTRKWIRILHSPEDKKKGLIYIHNWKRHNNGWVAQWAAGYMFQDALKPKGRSNAEHSRSYRQRISNKVEDKRWMKLQSATR